MILLKVTQKRSMKIYNSMATRPPEAPISTIKDSRANAYISNGRSVVALVRSDDRSTAVLEALKLLGGLDRILEGVKGMILLKPNCNTDDPFPASTHPEMVRLVAEVLINHKIPPSKIIIGDMSGKARGLPTKWTMENIGLIKAAQDLGLRLSFFEKEDEWVTLKHPQMYNWPEGVRIPRLLYEAERVISLPTMKTHLLTTFTLSLKNSVGFTDALGRDWLHNGEALKEKTAELNLTYTTDLIILDGIKCFTTGGPYEGKLVEPGIIIAGGDRVAVDAIGVAMLKQLRAEGIANRQVSGHVQLKWAAERGMGNLNADKIEIRASNPENDPTFSDLLSNIKKDLSS
jgi:uncharacterized protein (DUF362 family)